ncbi:hypothetical protein EV368DRAFT_69540 [Lentinula lateritia]|nr:hypothetical protein EV368DRAFT_69540 [Lentinula lateritia]
MSSRANRVSSADNPSALVTPIMKNQPECRQTRSSTSTHTVIPASETNKKRKPPVEPLGTKPKKLKSSPHTAPKVISKKKTAASQRNRPSNGTHQTRYRAVAINVDEEEVPPLRKWRSHNKKDHNTVTAKMVAKEAAEESASENDVDESDIEIEQERTEDQMAAHLFKQELTMFDEDKELKYDSLIVDFNDSMDDSAQDDRQNMVCIHC